MLVLDMREIGNKLLAIRKRMGMTQVEVAEAAGAEPTPTLNAVRLICVWRQSCEFVMHFILPPMKCLLRANVS